MSTILNRSVGALFFASCSIDDELACGIAENIKGGNDITSINMNHNKIGTKGIKILAESFKTLKNLTQIHLYGNPIDDDGFVVLFTALKDLKLLSYIDIRETKIGIRGLNSLSELFKSNSKLKMQALIFNKDNIIAFQKENNNNK
jgi:Ran GTPase-activating protein (RanGAP) involved in mRNA processing and transport